MKRAGTLLVGLLATAACYEGSGTDPIACTDIFVYGLSIDVRDAVTGLPAATGATLTVREGTYEEVVTNAWDGLTFAAAGERAGTYAITIEHPSYLTWTRAGVTVTADECHVIPVTITAELTPDP